MDSKTSRWSLNGLIAVQRLWSGASKALLVHQSALLRLDSRWAATKASQTDAERKGERSSGVSRLQTRQLRCCDSHELAATVRFVPHDDIPRQPVRVSMRPCCAVGASAGHIHMQFGVHSHSSLELAWSGALCGETDSAGVLNSHAVMNCPVSKVLFFPALGSGAAAA